MASRDITLQRSGCADKEKTHKKCWQIEKGWGVGWGGGFRIVKTVIATARRVNVYRSDEAVSLHLGREAIQPRSCECVEP